MGKGCSGSVDLPERARVCFRAAVVGNRQGLPHRPPSLRAVAHDLERNRVNGCELHRAVAEQRIDAARVEAVGHRLRLFAVGGGGLRSPEVSHAVNRIGACRGRPNRPGHAGSAWCRAFRPRGRRTAGPRLPERRPCWRFRVENCSRMPTAICAVAGHDSPDRLRDSAVPRGRRPRTAPDPTSTCRC